DPYSGRIAPLRRNLADRDTDHHPGRGDEQKLVVERCHERRDDIAAKLREFDPTNSLTTTRLSIEVVELGALAKAGVGDDHQVGILTGHVARDDLVAIAEPHAPDTSCAAA